MKSHHVPRTTCTFPFKKQRFDLMQVIASVAPFAVGFIGWQLTNNILERRRQEKAEEPPKLVDVPRVDEVRTTFFSLLRRIFVGGFWEC